MPRLCSTAVCALRILDAATIFIAFVIFPMFLMALMRCLTVHQQQQQQRMALRALHQRTGLLGGRKHGIVVTQTRIQLS